MENEIPKKASEIAVIRKKFDEVLVKHIRRLIENESLSTSISFNLSAISCLLLLVERENEIRDFHDSPPARYTRETFLDDISELGIEIDDELMASFQALAEQGYITIDDDEKYNAQISTFAVVSFLDNLFPGMPGMSFVAFVLQMMEEVISGRKNIESALNTFDLALLAKGIPLSKQKIKAEEKKAVKETVKKVRTTINLPPISENLKREFSDRLSKLRSLSKSSISSSGYVAVSDKWKGGERIKDIFPKGPSEDEIKTVEAAAKQAELAALEAEKKAAAIAVREAEIKSREEELRVAEIAAREAEIVAREAEIKAREAEIAARESEPEEKSEEKDNGAESETSDFGHEEANKLDIDKKIEVFQQSLASPCPICTTGKIFSQHTEKGQTYYSCSNENCGFISWNKPYHFECPLCKNPFLIEFPINDGFGLKCPRSTCSYKQDKLDPPALSSSALESDGRPQKRRKLVRKRKRI